MEVGMDVGRLLDRFLVDFGIILGSKLAPSWHQNPKKDGTQTMSKKIKKNNIFKYFCYVGHVILALKSNKIRPNILQKTTIKTMPQLGWILVPTWLHFGMVLGAKMGSSWVQITLRID